MPASRKLKKSDFDRIYDTSIRILSGIGIILDEPDTLKRLKSAGCTVSREGRLLFNESLVLKAVQSVPSSFTIFDQAGRPAVEAGRKRKAESRNYLAACLNSVKIFDRKIGRQRTAVLADITAAAKLCEKLDRIDMAAAVVTPNDVKPEQQAVTAVKAVTAQTEKPVAFTAHDERGAAAIWEHLADAAGGMSALCSKPCGLDLTGPTSPLMIGAEAVKRLQYAAAAGLPVVCYPGIIPGAASPITLSGTLAQSGAEILAGLVIHQLENPGAPVMSGSSILPMDMKTGCITYGSPEYAAACTAAVDFFSYLDIPSWAGGGCSDASCPGSQAAAEAQLTMNAAVLSGTDFIHNAGYLSSGRCASLEMLVLADELIRLNEQLEIDIDCSDEALGFELIKKAAFSESADEYMASEHTMKYLRSSMYYSEFFNRDVQEAFYPSESLWEKISAETEELMC